MNYVRLSPDEQRAVCEDLLLIERAGRWSEFVWLRHRLLREHRGASPWEKLDIDSLTRSASSLIGGTPGYWRDAAAAAFGIPSRVEACIEAACRIADEVRREEQEEESRQAGPKHRATLGTRKRGPR